MSLAKSFASFALASLAVVVTLAALACFQPGFSRARLAPAANVSHVGLSQLLALDRPEAPKAVSADQASTSSAELKDWSYTSRHRYFSSRSMHIDSQGGSFAMFIRQAFSFFSSDAPGYGGGSYARGGFGHGFGGGMPGFGVFSHRSHGSPNSSNGSPSNSNPNYGTPSYANNGSPAYANSGTPAYANAAAPSYPTPVTPTPVVAAPVTAPSVTPAPVVTPSNSYFANAYQQATSLANNSTFSSVRVRTLEFFSQTFERIVTNVGGVTTSTERTTLVSTIQVEVEVRRFTRPINASPCA